MNRIPYLIIGNSTAAVGAVEGLRSRDPDSPVTIVSQEEHHTYSRPLISHLLAGKVGEDNMFYRSMQFYSANNVTPLLGTKAVELDLTGSTVTTDSRDQLPYEKLLIATGGTPVLPAGIEGMDGPGVFSFVSWNDAIEIDHYITAHNVDRAVVVGGGMIGIKATEALVDRGIHTTVVEMADRVLASSFDKTGSELIAAELQKAGVDARCGTTLERIIRGEGRVAGAELSSGENLECGLVVLAIGVQPNIGLVEGTGVQVERGILVDERMESSVKGIYAAGDVAQAGELFSGHKKNIPILPNAYRQGRVAGINMAGQECLSSPVMPMNSLDIFGLSAISVGQSTAEDECCEMIRKQDNNPPGYRKIVLKNGRIIGAIFIGKIDRAGIITGLIRDCVDVSDCKDMLLNDQFGVLSLPRHYREKVVSGQPLEV